MLNCACSSLSGSKSKTRKSGPLLPPESTVAIAAHPFVSAGVIAVEGIQIDSLPIVFTELPFDVTSPTKASVELAAVELGVAVSNVTCVPADAMSLPNVNVPPFATFSFHSSPASAPASACNITDSAASFTADEITRESVVVSS